MNRAPRIVIWSAAFGILMGFSGQTRATTVTIVGDKGTVLRSPDGGGNWFFKQSPFPERDLLDVDCVDSDLCWAVGERGAIFMTTDGANSWIDEKTTNPVTNSRLRAVRFIDANNGWAVGDNGTIIRRRDGAWEDITPKGPRVDLYDIDCVDTRRCWTVGDLDSNNDGIIRHTDNGGDDWSLQASNLGGRSKRLEGVDFVNSTIGYATSVRVGADGADVIRTKNGGRTWEPLGVGHLTRFAIDCVDTERCWAVGGAGAVGGSIIRTIDMGATWTEHSPGSSIHHSVDFLDSTSIGWVVGREGGIYNTRDGQRFVPQSGGTSNNLNGVVAIPTEGDYNVDHVLNSLDIDLQAMAMRDPQPDLRIFDENDDGVVDEADRLIWVHDHAGTWLGDADLDGEFNSGDLTTVFKAGSYEDDIPLNSGWDSGDWNGDGDFTTSDLVAAFQDGGYEAGPRPSAKAVPEPSCLVLLAIGMVCLVCLRNFRK